MTGELPSGAAEPEPEPAQLSPSQAGEPPLGAAEPEPPQLSPSQEGVLLPDGVSPEGVFPEGVLPDGVLPEGVLPEGVFPPGVWLPEPLQSSPLHAGPVAAGGLPPLLPPAGVVLAAGLVTGTPFVALQPHGSVIVTVGVSLPQTVHSFSVTVKPSGI